MKAAARVDGSAVGPRAKVAGEVHASVVVGLSNKAHDGYLGNSYLGRWCNLGAGTDTSNLRNDYGDVSLWDPVAQDFLPTGRRFLGLVMADHAKCAIGTRFNTGTLVGVACNWFGAGFPPRRLPSFSWGGDGGLEGYRLDKAIRVAEAAMARRDRPLTEADRALLAAVFEASAGARAAVLAPPAAAEEPPPRHPERLFGEGGWRHHRPPHGGLSRSDWGVFLRPAMTPGQKTPSGPPGHLPVRGGVASPNTL